MQLPAQNQGPAPRSDGGHAHRQHLRQRNSLSCRCPAARPRVEARAGESRADRRACAQDPQRSDRVLRDFGLRLSRRGGPLRRVSKSPSLLRSRTGEVQGVQRHHQEGFYRQPQRILLPELPEVRDHPALSGFLFDEDGYQRLQLALWPTTSFPNTLMIC